MGRWGWRKFVITTVTFPYSYSLTDSCSSLGLFEGDQDLDAACCLAESLGIQTDDWEHSMSSMVHQTDMLADEGTRAFYRTEEYKRELENEIVPYVRANFDIDNFGDRFFRCFLCQGEWPNVPPCKIQNYHLRRIDDEGWGQHQG